LYLIIFSVEIGSDVRMMRGRFVLPRTTKGVEKRRREKEKRKGAVREKFVKNADVREKHHEGGNRQFMMRNGRRP
jgi:hypothetical protein